MLFNILALFFCVCPAFSAYSKSDSILIALIDFVILITLLSYIFINFEESNTITGCILSLVMVAVISISVYGTIEDKDKKFGE